MQQERELTTLADDETCQKVVEMIIGSYPNANPGDPATYFRAMRALLASYPATVVAAIASPRAGIVTKCKFPPTMAEVQEFADPMLERMQAALNRDRQTMLQIAPPPEPEITDEDREYVDARLDGLKRELAATAMKMRSVDLKPIKPLPTAQCAPGQAIRAHHGWSKPKGKTDVPEPETDMDATGTSVDSPDSHEPAGLRPDEGSIPGLEADSDGPVAETV